MRLNVLFLALALGRCVFSISTLCGAEPAARSLEEWRSFTATSSITPRAFLRADDFRLWFETNQDRVQFRATLSRSRIPTDGFAAGSDRLRRSAKSTRRVTPAEGWREAIVLPGEEWPALKSKLVESLAPPVRGHGRYYQGMLLERLIYRDAQGAAHSTTVENPPEPIIVDGHYSIQETLGALARALTQELSRRNPGATLFLVIAPRSSRFPQPLLLDLAERRCTWLMPEGLADPERALSLITHPEGLSALMLESHGWALIKNPISKSVRLLDLALQTIARLPRLPLPHGSPPPLTHAAGMDLVEWEQWMDKYTGTRREPATLQLLIDGEQFFGRLHHALLAATNRVGFESFIFDRDDVGVEVADLLKRRSPQVKTRLLIDRIGSLAAGFSPPATPMPHDFKPPDSITSYLTENSNVDVRHFLASWFMVDHSKVYLVDGRQAWVGGMNIGREYRVEWHDLVVQVEGPLVSSFERSFERHWAHAGPLGDLGYLMELFGQGRRDESSPPMGQWAAVRRLPTRTFWKPFSAAVQRSIQRSKSHIYVENPYLFDRKVVSDLIRARHRGVDARVILPRVNDFKLGGRSNLVIANLLLKHGVRVYFYPGMTHVKALLVDGWACVGSANLDHLSLRISQEDNIATCDSRFVAQLRRELFDADFARSFELTEPLALSGIDLLADLLAENL